MTREEILVPNKKMSLMLRKSHIFIYTLVLILVFLCLFFVDGPLFYWQQQFRGSSWDPIFHWSKQITDIGLAEYYFGFFIGMLIILNLSNRFKILSVNKKWFHLSMSALIALLLSGVLVHIIKILIGRHRPYSSDMPDALDFSPININWDYQSFPSGHSQVLFAVATVLSHFWPKGKIYFYPAAFCLALTRVVTNNHYLSDVFAGALVGYLGALWGLKIYYSKIKVQ